MLLHWVWLTSLEAGTRTLSAILQKIIGVSSSTLNDLFFILAITGIVQIIVGASIARMRRTRLLAGFYRVGGACFFGVFGFFASVFVLYGFIRGGALGMAAFIGAFSIVLGALFDHFFTAHLTMRQWLGIIVAIFAAYAILDFPSLRDLLFFPVWFWFFVGATILVTVNQLITQRIHTIDPFVKNFWSGIIFFLFSCVGVFFYGDGIARHINDFSFGLWVAMISIGVLTVVMIALNLMAYKAGAIMTTKNFLLRSLLLIFTVFSGWVFFHESITYTKFLGTLLFIFSFFLLVKPSFRIYNVFVNW